MLPHLYVNSQHKVNEQVRTQIFHLSLFTFRFYFVPLTMSKVLTFDDINKKKDFSLCIVLT